MSNENEVRDTLKKMAQLSISTNKINEVQHKNLGMYPFVFFNGVKTVSLEYDLTNHTSVGYEIDSKQMDIKYNFNKPHTKNFYIKYDLVVDESQDNSNLEKRFESLEKAICTLFWSGIPIEVCFNGKSVYKSKPNG